MNNNNTNGLFITDMNELYGGFIPAQTTNNLLGNNPEQAKQFIANSLANTPQAINQTQVPKYSLTGLGKKIVSNLEDMGTGLAYIGTHPKETANLLGNYLGEVGYKSGGNPLKNLGYITTDLTDAMLHPYSLDSATRNKNIGNIVGSALAGDYSGSWNYAKDAAAQAFDRAYNNAGYIGLDLVSLGLGKGLTKGIRAATKAEKGLAVSTAEAAKVAEQVRKPLDEINKVPTVVRAKLYEAAETGKWTDDIVQYKPLVKQFSEEYNKLVPEYAKVDRENQSIIQKFARDNGVTYQEAEKTLTPLLELPREAEVSVAQKGKDLEKLVPKIKYEETAPVFKYDEMEGALNANSPLNTQPLKYQEAINKLFDAEELQGLQGLNAKELDTAIRTKLGSNDAATAWYQRNGIGEMFDLETGTRTIFGKDRKASYNPKTNEITLYKDKMDALSLPHEQAHQFLNNLNKASKTNKNAKELIGEITNKFGDGSGSIDYALHENFAPKYAEWVASGKPLDIDNVSVFKKVDNIINKTEKTITPTNTLETLAKSGDKAAQAVIEGHKLFKQGDIFPITHAMESADEAAKAAGFANEVGGYAGRFSKRGYGLTTYEKMAQALKAPNEILENQMRSYAQGKIGQQLIDGHIGGQSVLPTSAKDTLYVSREALENGNILRALKNASKEMPKGSDVVPIDKHMAKAISEQLTPLESAYKGIMKDIYAIQKGNLLSQGTYLAGNAITGVTNTLMNSGLSTIDDIVQAIGTKGKLAKQMGLYRRNIPKTYKNKVTQTIQNANDISGAKLFRHLDRTIQNSIAEIAAHANLRKLGIKSPDRLAALDKLSLDKLGEAIVDTKRVALLNSNRTILPRWVTQGASTVNPFWQWGDTAAQSTLWMLRKNPAIANVALVDVLSNIGFNAEMQNRLNLNVSLDKPLVSYRFDNKTGQIKEATAEFVPMMNTLRFISDTGRYISGDKVENLTLTNTALGEIFMAAQGKNRYGKPLRSKGMVIQGDKRYRQNPVTKQWEVVNSGTPAEVLTAIGRTTFGLPNVVNKTVAPTVAEAMSELTGRDYNFYRPYDDSLFGQILPQGVPPTTSNILMGGDPTRPRTGREIQNAMSGIYETTYYPERPDITSQRQLRSILLNRARNYNRGLENIMR